MIQALKNKKSSAIKNRKNQNTLDDMHPVCFMYPTIILLKKILEHGETKNE